MRSYYVSIFILLILLCFNNNLLSQNLSSEFDEILNETFHKNEPGATVLIAKNGEVIYRNAFGLANMELDVKMQVNNVFEIGSITKQFTAVSILMLLEQGKIDLDDDITKYIEDYPTHGHHISIHHLLNHTSGIKSYTSMASWVPLWRKDFTPIEMIDFFKKEPMDFAPGQEWSYNNSAYFILGYIIEKVSGEPYETYIEQHIFKPLNMKSTLYGSNKEIIKNRAYGYQKSGKYTNAEYLSLTQPYSAGSIMSTVDDLFIWNRAIKNNLLLQPETIQLAFTNYTLNNGDKTNYGYGWSFGSINGSPTIEHSGGIFGYVTNSIYLPEEDVFVAIYSNCDCSDPTGVSNRLASIAIGKPFPGKKDIVSITLKELEKWEGIYDFEDGSIRTITIENGKIYSQKQGSTKFEIFPMKNNVFFFDGIGSTISFEESNNIIKAVFKNNEKGVIGLKSERIPKTISILDMSEKDLQQFVGTYNLAPNFDIIFSISGGKFKAQATGQQEVELFPETQTKFFLKDIEAKIEFFPNQKGEFDSCVLYQGGRETKGMKKN